ncbi:MAG: hypothetical protein JEY79_13815 [Pseudodesulfovibrio sp.]|nr:hypothetical protein [Pseudodesulfovibrio sp.]
MLVSWSGIHARAPWIEEKRSKGRKPPKGGKEEAGKREKSSGLFGKTERY